MSKFPTQIDDDTDLPPVNDNLTEVGSVAINATRDAIFNIEGNIGIGAAGNKLSIAERLGVSLDDDGNIKASMLTSLNLVPDSITNLHIKEDAGIDESKLRLDFKTQDLYNYTRSLVQNVNTISSWITLTGIKLEPHIAGTQYRHDMDQIDVSSDTNDYLKNKFGVLRNNANSYALTKDINSELLAHQFADGSPTTGNLPITTNGGGVYGSDYAHTASGVFLDVRNFTFIPQTANDVQKFAEFVNTSNINIIGTRIQSFYSNGISKSARSSNLIDDSLHFNSTVGQALVPYTEVKTYLLESGNFPNDNIDTGDDLIKFFPAAGDGYKFDAAFNLVNIGDVVTINYENINGSSLTLSYLIKEKKFNVDLSGNKSFAVRINGHNIYGSNVLATGRIDKALFNTNKYGVLALSKAQLNGNLIGALPSLTSSSPRGASALGMNFNSDLITSSNYNLYLQFYPNGTPSDYVVNLPAIDVTGNAGTTPGQYTLDSIVDSINTKFRLPGFNYRFAALQYQGQIGVMVADSYNNASFAIMSGVLDPSTGIYSQSLSNTSYPNNVIDIFNNIDPLGFGPNNSNIASPPFAASFSIGELAKTPTKVIVPLKRNNYYVNGSESEKFIDGYEVLKDQYDDGYWISTIFDRTIVPGSRVTVKYKVNIDLSPSNLQIGKTLVVQPIDANFTSSADYGRFIISNVEYVSACDTNPPYTIITVYDAIHGVGTSPSTSSAIGTTVRIYFNDSSIGFNGENSSDINVLNLFKRHFEIYIDKNGHTFSHERARFNISGSTATINSNPPFSLYTNVLVNPLNIYSVSPKLKGYKFGLYSKVSVLSNYDSTTGIFDGYVCKYDGSNATNIGATFSGKKGELIRMYNESTIDYIDVIFDLNGSDSTVSSFTNAIMDIQIYPTLSLDEELMLLGTCQVNDSTKDLKYLRDLRQFGNISERQLSNSALNFISAGDRLLHQNGVIKGLDITGVTGNAITIRGGTALINGNIVNVDNEVLSLPLVQEVYSSTVFTKINWTLCVNDKNDFEFIPLTDYDAVSPATPNAPQRVFVAKNPVAATTYAIDSVRFIDIVESRKDLVALYRVTSIVDGYGALSTSLVYHDARKYVANIDSIISPVLSDQNTQSNFHSIDSVATWLNYNSRYFTDIGIKTDVGVNQAYTFNSSYTVKFNGNNVSTLNLNSGANVTFTNFHFNEMPIVINSGVTVIFTNCIFENSQITLNTPITLSSSNTFINSRIIVNSANGIIINSDDIRVDKCTFTYNYDSTGDVGYTSGNGINYGFGMITVLNSTAFQFKNLSIANSKFIATTANHYALICVEFNTNDSHYQDVLIANNRFYSTTGTQLSPINDARGAIVFVNNVITAVAEGPRLVNAFIKDNLFDKNQIIAITTKRNSQTVNNAISTINCVISNNTCGEIRYLNRYEDPHTTANYSSLVRDKDSLLTIEGNVCTFISNDASLFDTVAVETGKVIISKNSVANIQANICSNASLASERRSTLVISDNVFSFKSFANGNPALFLDMALLIFASGVTTNPGSVIITNNIFDRSNSGTYAGQLISCNAPAIITDNIFKGVSNAVQYMIYCDTSSIITGNAFYRGTSTLTNGYIGLNDGDCIVTDNSFDFPTIDGASNENLLSISGSASVIYERNKNQSGFVYVSLYHETPLFNDIPLDNGRSTDYTSVSGGKDHFMLSRNNNSTTTVETVNASNAFLQFLLTKNITNELPTGVTVLQTKVGIFNTSGAPIKNSPYNANNQIKITYTVNDGSTFMDVKNNKTNARTYSNPATYTITNVTDDGNLSSNTQYLTIVPASPYNKVSHKYQISIETLVFIEYQFGGIVDFSPIEIKYRW